MSDFFGDYDLEFHILGKIYYELSLFFEGKSDYFLKDFVIVIKLFSFEKELFVYVYFI